MKTLTALLILAALSGCAAFRMPSERAVTVTSKPELKHYQGVTAPGILLHKDGVTYQSGWVETGQNRIHLNWPAAAPQPVSLNPASTYTFDLLVEKNWLQMGFSRIDTIYTATLVRLRHNDRTLYDGTLCPLHHVAMSRQLVPIAYGYAVYSAPFAHEAAAHFPNARLKVEGGCSPNPAHKETFIWVCPACEAASKQYAATHKS